jgi:CubicO group peptidase (beta-lactamase class C family)
MSIAERVNSTVETAIREQRIVGAVVLVTRNGQVVCDIASGLDDRDAGTPLQRDAIFRLSSLTKPIVATTVLAMADAGLLSLDQPMTDHLPRFRPRLADGTEPLITLEHLITHTSGLNGEVPLGDDERSDPAISAVGGNLAHLPLEVAVQRLCRAPLQFVPGTNWAYSWGIDVLGAVLEKITGDSLGAAVSKYVTGPLGMTDTAFVATDTDRLATAYADSDSGRPVVMDDPHVVPNPFGGLTRYHPGRATDPKVYHSGGGGMSGTAPDFMRLLETLRTGGGKILRSDTVARGAADRIPANAVCQKPGWKFGYFGAVLDDPVAAGSPLNKGAYRWGGIYGHTWFIDPEADICCVAMTNTGLEGCDGAFPEEIRRAVAGRA